MKDPNLADRIPAEIAAAHLTTRPTSAPVVAMPLAAFFSALATAPRLSADEAAAYEADLREARAALPPLDDPWT